MPHATIRTLFLALAVAVALCPIASFACDQCGFPQTVSCLHENILDFFEDGGGDEPAAFTVGGGGTGWTGTATGTRPTGEPAILTWSIVPDGTSMPSGLGEPAAPSNLIAFLDNIAHGGPGPGGTDLTQRGWFDWFKSSFDRWDAVSGLRISYEPNDDAVPLGGLTGILGRRGDIRIGGHNIDGDVRPSVVAYNYYPNNADMVIDTSETTLMGNPGGNYIRLRNMIMHETGHGLGLNHPASSDSRFLMEALLDTGIDGPQFDDILGIHQYYGDRYEEFGGNDNPATATNLGSFSPFQSIKLGEDAVDKTVAPTDVDFVSINKTGDADYFKLSVSSAGLLDIILSPIGPTYMSGPHGGTQTLFNASMINNLSVWLYDSSGVNLLASSATGGLGVVESILNYPLTSAGDYFVRVSGAQNAAQFYQLDISFIPEPTGLVLLTLGMMAFVSRRRSA